MWELKLVEFIQSTKPSSKLPADRILQSKDLFQDGIVDSLLMLQILSYLQKDLGIKIPALLVTRKSFQSIAAISQMIQESKLN